MFLDLNTGIKLHYEISGNENGDVILFIHGNCENLAIFDYYREPLKDHKLIFVDSRCHGESSQGKLDYNLMADDMISLLNELNIKKCSVVGFSDGAIIGLIMAIKTDLISKLFALGVNISPDGIIDEGIEHFKKDYKETGSIFSKLCLDEPHISAESLNSIESRVIVVGGEFDLIKREHLELIKDNIKNSCLYIIPSCDHFAVVKDPEKVLSIIENELSINVYYEDHNVIVVEKEAGILSQEDITKEKDLLSMTKEYLRIKYKKPGNAYLALIQRLDRNVSGLMLFAKSSKAAARLNANRPEKTYLAVVYGKMEKSKDRLINYLSKDEDKKIAYEDKNGKQAVLEYEAIGFEDNLSLLKVEIETGRFHQIRCQLSLIGHPIFNDSKYNKNCIKDGYDIGLDAYKVDYIDPTSKIPNSVKRYPTNKIFNKFDIDVNKL